MKSDADWLPHSRGNCQPVQDYQKVNRIGEGTYGYVYRAIHRQTNQIVALKRIILHNEQQDGFPLTSIREVNTLRQCSHPNIVKLIDVVVGNNRDAVFLLFEYCENDLSAILKAYKQSFREGEVKQLILQLLSAVQYLHSRWIIHRDIKLSNLLYTSRGRLKLADFGLARTLSYPSRNDLTPTVVTLWYRAPELLLGTSVYSFSVDVWSIGCILGELLLYEPVFSADNDLDQILAIFAILGAPSEKIYPDLTSLNCIKNNAIDLAQQQQLHPYNVLPHKFTTISPQGLDLLHSFFTYDPKYRIKARDAATHEYFYCSPYPISPDLMPTFPSLHDDNKNDKKKNRDDTDEKRNRHQMNTIDEEESNKRTKR